MNNPLVTLLLLLSFINIQKGFCQSKLDSLFELEKECLKETSSYQIDLVKKLDSTIQLTGIQSNQKLLIELENYSTDTLELKYDCGLYHFLIEVQAGSGTYTQNKYCDHWENSKFNLNPSCGIKSCFLIDNEWIGRKVRIGIEIDQEITYSEWINIEDVHSNVNKKELRQ